MDGDDTYEAALDDLADREDTGSHRFLQEVLYSLETVSMGTHQLLYFSAMRYAGTYLDCAADDLDDAVDQLADRFHSMDVGTLTLEEKQLPARVALADNVVVDAAPATGRRMCYFIAGYIAGFLENCLDDGFVVNETECMADGAETCEFRVQKR
ncbi:MAG: V4R domain-containing protein [Candidatus Nanohaloarchaea archaeon]|nr:V4R domain-containing protein [Candidatus Nanohaloarchaea archaeon]